VQRVAIYAIYTVDLADSSRPGVSPLEAQAILDLAVALWEALHLLFHRPKYNWHISAGYAGAENIRSAEV